ncbi:MAG: 4-(cytidine 5'-diphospho)-2-C-methyl-D-erythritol kinase [Vicinamibacterales bacterium]|nr:4-(cytidine 5'-diphospho)-2-C-methyl-D-erythritol kinase [Vicinamibacterales bacterium]
MSRSRRSTMDDRRWTMRAFAKINLSLRIGPKGSDGFHEVRTILQGIDLADRVVATARRGPFEIACSAPDVPVDPTNLVWKAAQHLWKAAGRAGDPRDAHVALEKRIPARAGLGGGSSDAAAALVLLRRLWKLNVPDDALRAIAATIGSDVPYFLVGGTALGLGRGEDVYPLEDLPRFPVVLVFPDFGVATVDAYSWLDERQQSGDTSHPPAGYLETTWLGRGVGLYNDLEPPVIERHPGIGKLKRRLMKMGAAMAAMSGSGSTVFGVFSSARAAHAAAGTLHRSGARVLTARFLPRPKR